MDELKQAHKAITEIWQITKQWHEQEMDDKSWEDMVEQIIYTGEKFKDDGIKAQKLYSKLATALVNYKQWEDEHDNHRT